MSKIDEVEDALQLLGNKQKAIEMARFFKTGPGEYGEGDRFIGVTVPDQRSISKHFFKEISLYDIAALLKGSIHEYRLTALFMLVLKYQKAKKETEKQAIVNTYLENLERVNNWDLVDSSCYLILGSWLENRERNLLYEMANSSNLWQQRIAMITTMYFIRKGDFKDALALAEILLHHEHDLIHKAVGWMLREIGNRDFKTEFAFLKTHYTIMPRTALRYAIEKFDEELRQQFLKGTIQ